MPAPKRMPITSESAVVATDSNRGVVDVPTWVDRELYPFTPRSFASSAGTISYLDEGEGRPIVFVHGNPAWSFEWRGPVLALRNDFRCIAPDLLGFGLSDKPDGVAWSAELHATLVGQLLDHLDLRDVVIVVNDWGGPVGLSWALANADRVGAVVVSNTWLWSVRRDWYFQAFSKFMGGPIGARLIRRRNFFVNSVMVRAMGHAELLSQHAHDHYRNALPTPGSRAACAAFPKQIIGASSWLEGLWGRRDVLAAKPMLLAWGMRDIAFRPRELRVWQQAFPHAVTHEFAEAGHFVAEEDPDGFTSALRTILAREGGRDASVSGRLS